MASARAFSETLLAVHDMVDVKLDKSARVVLGTCTLDLDVVVGHVLAFFVQDRYYIGRGACGDGDEQHFDRGRGGTPIAFGINELGMWPLGGVPMKNSVARILLLSLCMCFLT